MGVALAEADPQAFLGHYCREKVFLFLPNVCDAACDFCYVRPTRVTTARLSNGVIDRAAGLFRVLRSYGFGQVRLTGGEPLVFQNLEHLIRRLVAERMDYTLLTNGIRLGSALGWLRRYPPAKTTVSMHSVNDAGAVFGRPVDVGGILAAIEELTGLGTDVAATMVCVPPAVDDLAVTVKALAGAGVRDFKIVNVNDARYALAPADFSYAVGAAREAAGPSSRVRYTDMGRRTCLLRQQGELSVTLPAFEWSWCCATVGTSSLGVASTSEQFGPVVERLRRRLAELSGLPCAHQGYCPIALTESVVES